MEEKPSSSSSAPGGSAGARLGEPVVIVGIGELGSLFARGFLRLGHPVVPVVRGMSPLEVAGRAPTPELVLVAVAEADLDPVLSSLPPAYRRRTALLQNELLPRDWERHGLEDPTVIVVWFEKKANRPVKSLLPSAVYGPGAELAARAIEQNALPVRRLASPEELLLELVTKNLYILSINLAGLPVGGTVRELREHHADWLHAVTDEVLDLQEALVGSALPRGELLKRREAAFDADPDHVATGRSAPARLARALDDARRLGVPVPTLEALQLRAAESVRDGTG